MMILKSVVAVALLVALIIVYLAVLSWTTRDHPLKSESPRAIDPCAEKPNCVSSNDTRPGHRIEPLPLHPGDPTESWAMLLKIVEQAGGEIRVADGHYCHAVFTSTLFRFRDDLEAVLRHDRIDIRSASRAGTSDLGVNRKRIDAIRAQYLSASD